MELYDLIFEKIQKKYVTGELTLEQANEVNELAYNRYVIEAEEDHEIHYVKKSLAARAKGVPFESLKNKKI